MKKILFILLTFCMSIFTLEVSAQSGYEMVSIGNSSSSSYSYSPFAGWYGFTWSAQMYLNSELENLQQGSTIEALSWHFGSSTSSTNGANVQIYMTELSANEISGTLVWDNLKNNATLVYNGACTPTANDWWYLSLTTPYEYNGGNLVIIYEGTGCTTSGGCTKYVYGSLPSNNNLSWTFFKDGSTMSGTSTLSNLFSLSANNSHYRADIKIYFEEGNISCHAPSSPSIDNISAHSADMSWGAGEEANSYDIYVTSTATDIPDSVTVPTGMANDTTYNITGLNASTVYYAYVRSNCGNGDVSRWKSISFRTACDNIYSASLPYTEDFGSYGMGSNTNFPICWYQKYTTPTAYPYISSTNSGSLYFYATSGTYSCAATEVVDNSVTLSDLLLSFQLYKGSAAYNIKVGVMEDPDSVNTFETLAILSPTATSTWEDFEITFDQYTGTGRHIAFMVDGRGENDAKYMYLDNVTIQTMPNCRRVVGLNVDALNADGATISWTEQGSATTWEVAVDIAGFDIDTYTGSFLTATTNPYTISGLNTNTSYDVYVRSVCGAETGAWSSPKNFMTPSNPASLPYSCDFEDANENDNWTIVNNSYINQWVIDTAANDTDNGSYALYVSQDTGRTNTYNNTSASYVWAYRDIDFGTTYGEYIISFDWKGYGESGYDYLKVYIGAPRDVSNTGSTIPSGLATVSTNYGLNNNWKTDTIYATSFFQGIQRLYFFWRNDGTAGTNPAIAVDNIHVEGIECGRPLNLTITETTTTSISIEFDPAVSTDNSWDVVIVENGAEWDETDAFAISSSQYTFTDLTPATAYDIHIRTSCGSRWTSLSNVATDCELITELPFRANFDNVATSVMPICWNRVSTAGNYPYTSTSYAYSSPNSLYFYSGSTSNYTIGILPELDENIDVNTLSISFVMHSSSTSYPIVVGILSALDGSTFVPVDTLTLSATNTWEEKEVDFANYTGNGKHIGFKYINSTAMYVDNVVLYETSSCLKPINVQLSNITPDGVTVNWTARNGEGSWAVVVVPHGEDPETSNAEITSEHPYIIEGLTDATAYDVYVKALCDNESPWSTAAQFTTLCLPTDEIPYVEDFDEFGSSHSGQAYFPSCWTRKTDYTSTSYPYISTTYHKTGTSSLYFYSTSTNYSMAVTQGLDLSQYEGSSLLLSFYLYKTSSSYGRLDVGVITDPSDPSTMTVLKSIYPDDLSNTSTWYEMQVEIPVQSQDPVYLAFLAPQGTTNYVYLDHVTLEEATCSSPSNLTVSSIAGTSALVSWTAAMFEPTDYIVEYSEAGQDVWVSTNVIGTSTVLSGLTPETSYQVRVYSNCDDASDTLNETFATPSLVSCDLTIGNGTSTSNYLPSYSFYNYSYSQQLFTSAELGNAGNINSISLQMTTFSQQRSYSIYMMHTSATSIPSSSFLPADSAQLVCSTTPSLHTGWNTFTFSQPFAYNGTDNLVLIMIDGTGSYASSPYNAWNTHTAPFSGSARYIYQDSNPYSVTTTPTSGSGSSTLNVRNNIIFGRSCDSVITCVAPNIYDYTYDNESITINWVAGNGETAWELKYKAATDNDWTIETVTTSPFVIDELTPNTTYTIQMRSDCGNDEYSEPTGFSVTTYCDYISLPLHEDFESLSTGSTAAFLPCWFKGTNYSTAYPYVTTQSSAPNGTKTLYFYGATSNYSYVATPRFEDEVLMDSLQITFNAYKGSASYLIEIGIMSDPRDYSTFELIGSFSPSATSTWQDAEILTRGYQGDGHHVAFRIPAWYSNYMYIDDININYIPNCMHITNLHTTVIDSSSATISWVAGGDETEWEVVLVPGSGGNEPDEEADIEVVEGTPVYEATDLNSASFYTIYVRANCGDSHSYWERLIFQTTQTPGQLPYFCDFEDANPQFGFMNTGSVNQWHIGTATNNGGTHAMYISQNYGVANTYNTSSTSNSWAYRDIYFPACANGYTFSFDWHGNGESGFDYMKVYWGNPVNIPANSTTQPAGSTAMQPNVNASYADRFNTLTGQAYQNFTTTLPGLTTGAVKRIYFYWHNDGSSGTTPPAAVDNISISAIYCAAPTNLTVSDITAYSAEVTWTSTASSCVLYYKANNDEEWIIDDNATSPYSLTGLDGNTTYTVRVANNCEDGENTSPFITATFTTSCVAMTSLPYEENFDGIAGSTSTSTNVLPNCWSRFNGGSSYAGLPAAYQTTSSHSGSNCLYFYTYYSDTYHDQYAVLPELDETTIPLNTVMLSFSARSSSTSYPFNIQVGVLSDPTDSSSFQLVQTITVTGTNYVTKEAYFNNFTGTGSHIALKVAKPASSGYNYGYIDDIVLSEAPACSPVNNLTVSHIAGASAMISWESGHFGTVSSYTVEYSEAGEENWITATSSLTSTSYMLSGLEPQTAYDVRVKVNCDDNDESEWVEESFTTRCLAGGELAFANGTATNSYIPSYSTYENGYTQQLFTASEIGGATNITSISFEMAAVSQQRHFKIYLMHTTESNLSSGWIPASTAQLKFSGNHTFEVGWNTFNFTTPFAYNGTDNLLLIVIDENDSWTGGNTWRVHDAFTGSARYTYQDNTPYSISTTPSATGTALSVRNNVIFGGNCDSTATCFAPNMYVDNITTSSADVIWVPGYDETAWELEYTLYGDSVWTPVANPTGGTITIDQLNSNTHYMVRMRSDCGGGDYSISWAMADFRTECGVESIPFTEDFSSYGTGTNVYPSCWSKHNTYSTTTSYPYISTTNNPGSLGGSLYFYASASTYDIAVIPELDIDVTTLEVSFYLRVGTTSNGMIVGVMDSRTDFDSFVPVDTVFCSSTSTFQYQEVDLDNYTGTGRFIAFKSYNTASGALYLDDINIYTIPSCKRPANVTVSNIDMTSAVVAWTERGIATAWEIEYGTPGFTPGTSAGTTVQATQNPYTLTGLTAGTEYDVYVRSNCGSGDLSNWSIDHASFATEVCSSADQCEYMFVCEDEYGDGWNGASISVQQNGVTVATVAAIDHNLEEVPTVDTVRVMLCDNVSTSFIWNSGSYDDEISLTIIAPDGTQLYNEADMSEITSTTLLTFTTDCGGVTPPTDPTVTTNAATAIMHTSATLNGVVNNPDNVTITARGFEWKAVSATTYTVVNLTGTSNTLTHNLTGLTANTPYTYKAFITFNGNTVYGNDVTFNTLPEDVEPCDAPTNLAFNNVTTTTVTVTWTAVGSATTWKVQYRPQGATQYQESTVQTTSFNMEGLTPNTTYQIQVKAICDGGIESDFLTGTVTTQSVSVDNITLANSINLMPNPADNYIDLRINSNVNVKEAVVYNAFGQMVQTVELNDNYARIDLNNMAAGMYFVRVNGENVMATKKFIKR